MAKSLQVWSARPCEEKVLLRTLHFDNPAHYVQIAEEIAKQADGRYTELHVLNEIEGETRTFLLSLNPFKHANAEPTKAGSKADAGIDLDASLDSFSLDVKPTTFDHHLVEAPQELGTHHTTDGDDGRVLISELAAARPSGSFGTLLADIDNPREPEPVDDMPAQVGLS
jgi:hypothetical protein